MAAPDVGCCPVSQRPCSDAKKRTTSATNFSRENHLLVPVRSDGHKVAGNAVCDDGLMIDLSQMKGIRVDPQQGTARVQPGVTLGDLDWETQLFGLATPTGLVSETGLADLTLGGGFGWLSRNYRVACDNLLSARVVTADGEVLWVSDDEPPISSRSSLTLPTRLRWIRVNRKDISIIGNRSIWVG